MRMILGRSDILVYCRMHACYQYHDLWEAVIYLPAEVLLAEMVGAGVIMSTVYLQYHTVASHRGRAAGRCGQVTVDTVTSG